MHMSNVTIEKFADRCLKSSKVIKPCLTTARFRNDVRALADFCRTSIQEASTPVLLALFVDYLRVENYSVVARKSVDEYEHFELTYQTPSDIAIDGEGLFVPDTRVPDDYHNILRNEGAFVLVAAPRVISYSHTELGAKHKPIYQDEFLHVIMALVLDRFYDEYFYTITSLPSLRKAIPTIVEEELGVPWQYLIEVADKLSPVASE